MKTYERIANIWDNKEYNAAVSRAKRMSTHEILNWIDGEAGTGMFQAVSDYRRHGSSDSLLELRRAISEFQALIEELLARESLLQ